MSANHVTHPLFHHYSVFGVNMPLLYGEGETAFIRLQTEIMKKTSDETIFAWIAPPSETFKSSLVPSGLLAASPRVFRNSGSIRKFIEQSSYKPVLPYDAWRPPFEMANNCLHISLFLLPADRIYKQELSGAIKTLDYGSRMKKVNDYSISFFKCVREDAVHLRMAVFLQKENLGHPSRYPNSHFRVWTSQLL